MRTIQFPVREKEKLLFLIWNSHFENGCCGSISEYSVYICALERQQNYFLHTLKMNANKYFILLFYSYCYHYSCFVFIQRVCVCASTFMRSAELIYIFIIYNNWIYIFVFLEKKLFLLVKCWVYVTTSLYIMTYFLFPNAAAVVTMQFLTFSSMRRKEIMKNVYIVSNNNNNYSFWHT